MPTTRDANLSGIVDVVSRRSKRSVLEAKRTVAGSMLNCSHALAASANTARLILRRSGTACCVKQSGAGQCVQYAVTALVLAGTGSPAVELLVAAPRQ